MKRSCKIMSFAALAALILWSAAGCGTKEPGDGKERKSRVQVRMRGALPSYGKQTPTRAETVYGPLQGGLPPHQLDVAIVTVNHTTLDPKTDQPGFAEWASQTADFTRGFFGSDDEGGILEKGEEVKNGQIEYVNDTGEFIQRVFYPEALNEYYFLKVVYPYESAEFAQMPDGSGAAVAFSGLTGHQDLLASNLGWGSQLQPVVETDFKITDPSEITVLKFEHLFAQLRFWIVAENENARGQYGSLDSLIVRFQPDSVVYRVMDGALMKPTNVREVDYHASYFFDGKEFTDAKIDFLGDVPVIDDDDYESIVDGASAGWVMVMPQNGFRIEAYSSTRKWIGADYHFKDSNGLPLNIEPGKIYDITLKFMEAYKLEIKLTDVKEWWMDSVFD